MGTLSFVGILLILIILGIVCTIWASARRKRFVVKLCRDGVAVRAEVVELKFVPAVWNDDSIVEQAYYSLTYRFCAQPGGEHQTPYIQTIAVSRFIGDDLEVGLYVSVLYLPGNPAVSMLEAEVNKPGPISMGDYAKVFFMFTTAVALLLLLLTSIHF